MHVLLVDDDDRFCTVLVAALTKAGHRVSDMPDAEQALALAGTVPDLLVTDVDLGPGLDGIALAAEAHRRWPLIRVILFSGLSGSLIGRPAEAADRFLLKPFHAGALLQSIVELTAGSAATDRRSGTPNG
ncbi:MAG TPA: response regulator [Acetobacteraceae bacterium]|nr:response regulator [Acetobacteraceae bacterium]